MKKVNILLGVLFFLGFTIITNGQNSIPISGGNATGSGGAVSYTLGQIFYTKTTDITGSVAHGVQQPFELSILTSSEEVKGISLELLVYPNPATDLIRLKIENFEVENLRYQFYNIHGNILLSNKIEVNETIISMQNFMPSTYFLKVIQGNKNIKIFKIIKH